MIAITQQQAYIIEIVVWIVLLSITIIVIKAKK